jgi:hypothetical protein
VTELAPIACAQGARTGGGSARARYAGGAFHCSRRPVRAKTPRHTPLNLVQGYGWHVIDSAPG